MKPGRRSLQTRPFHRLMAAGCAALILVLAILAASPSLHQRLHGEVQPDSNDSCAVVLFSSGFTEAAVAAVLAVLVLVLAGEIAAAPARLDLASPRFQLPPGRGPPAAW